MLPLHFEAEQNAEDGFWILSMPALMIASSIGCIWFRRRRRGDIRRQIEERHLQQVVSISIQHQRQEHHQTHAAPPVPHQSSYIVPRGAYVGYKVEDDQMIDWAEISVEDDTLLKESCTPETYFQMKLNWLESQLRKLHQVDDHPITVAVDRNDLFYDSFRAFSRLSGEQLRSPLALKFKKEDGRDDGGLTRHWFMLISREVTNPEYGLFAPLGKNRAYQINTVSKHQPHHLEYFRFIGRVWGKAIFDGFLVESHFVSTIYKYLMGKDITPSDLGVVDNTYYSSLQWILENDIEHAELDLTFVIDEEEFGAVTQVELKEGGKEMAVTNDNKDEYVQLICMQRLVNSIKPQLDALKEGFYDIMPPDVLQRFSEEELELVLCGLPVIDIEDWKANCDYKAGYKASDQTIVWYWEILQDWDQEMRARLLQFVTGTSKVPTGGFANLYGATGPRKFQIVRVVNTLRLPQANTCFNELLLPPYSSKERLAHCLTMSLYDGGDVFGLR